MVTGQKTIKKRHGKKQKATFSEGLEIVVARSLDEIEAIRHIWERMQHDEPYPVINADIDRYISVLESQKDRNVRPHVILLKYQGRAEAMVIGRVERRQFHCRIGYKTLFKPHLRWSHPGLSPPNGPLWTYN